MKRKRENGVPSPAPPAQQAQQLWLPQDLVREVMHWVQWDDVEAILRLLLCSKQAHLLVAEQIAAMVRVEERPAVEVAPTVTIDLTDEGAKRARAAWDERTTQFVTSLSRFLAPHGNAPLRRGYNRALAALPATPESHQQLLHRYALYHYVALDEQLLHHWARGERGEVAREFLLQWHPQAGTRLRHVYYWDTQRQKAYRLTEKFTVRVVKDAPEGAEAGVDAVNAVLSACCDARERELLRFYWEKKGGGAKSRRALIYFLTAPLRRVGEADEADDDCFGDVLLCDSAGRYTHIYEPEWAVMRTHCFTFLQGAAALKRASTLLRHRDTHLARLQDWFPEK